jgi:C-terminal processing protease CtpA/Prc
MNVSTDLFPGLCNYPDIKKYDLTFTNPKSKAVKKLTLKSITHNEYNILNAEKQKPNYSFNLLDSLSTGIIKISSFNFNMDSVYTDFILNTFKELKSKNIQNLIIDVRGNIGGQPNPATELLKNITSKELIYFSKKSGYEKFNNTVTPTEDRFKGNIYFLIDGGCRSTTGHLASLVKYHQLGKMIGEETCASYSCNSSAKTYILNNSKLTIDCPSKVFEVAVEGQQRGNGIMPDIYLKPTVENVMNGKDTVMMFTLDKIKNTGK